MRKPNFFIIGAPKCGTTSLVAYLSDHPNVYMSSIKEPHFFNEDEGWRHRRVDGIEAYLSLFSGAHDRHVAVGEASTSYLFSQSAVPNIVKFNPRARFVVMLRNPIDMAYSLHAQLLWNGDENVRSFEEAWDLQDIRLRGDSLPRLSKIPQWLQYRNVCSLGEQVERLFEQVSREQVLIITQDELAESAQAVYEKTVDFLGLPAHRRQDFEVVNAGKTPRSPLMAAMIEKACLAKERFELATGIRTRMGMLQSIATLNTRQQRRPPLSTHMRAKLAAAFAGDLEKLSKLIGRDVSGWIPSESVGEIREMCRG